LCEAIAYLHTAFEKPVSHRDVTCANVFVNNYTGDVALGDLGFAAVTSTSRTSASILGTAEYMAPEVLRGQYGPKADVYAFGMSLIEMATQKKPYTKVRNVSQLYMLILDQTPPDELLFVKNLNLRDVIVKCLLPEEKRPSAMEVLLLPFFVAPEMDIETVEDITLPNKSFGFFKNPIERYCLTRTDT
jgi:WNK lysine deficient protein kinase